MYMALDQITYSGAWLFIEDKFECVCLRLTGTVQTHVTTYSIDRVSIASRCIETGGRHKRKGKRRKNNNGGMKGKKKREEQKGEKLCEQR